MQHTFERYRKLTGMASVITSVLCSLLLINPASAQGRNLLSNQWISCSNNILVRTERAPIRLNSECIFQELDAAPGDDLNLVCDTRGRDFSSIQLSFSNSSFRVLRSSADNTTSSKTLRTSLDNAPQNTRFAAVTLFSNGSSTMNCALTKPQTIVQPPQQPAIPAAPVTPAANPVPGPCIDSDGDGFGWNGVSTCIPDTVTPTRTTASNLSNNNRQNNNSAANQNQAVNSAIGPCIDSDGDGFGWNGVSTCLVSPATNQPSRNTTVVVSNPATTSAATNRPANNPTANTRTPGFRDITDLILITGQSNAQGARTQVNLNGPDRPNARVFAYIDSGTWEIADLRQHWDGPNEQRHPGQNALIFPTNIPHNNFALHFGKALVELDPQRVVGFVLASSPGAGIRQWDQGSSFYRTVTNKAINALNASAKTTFDGVLWHQGETDFQFNGTSDRLASASERLASNYYPDRLNRLIANLRREPWFTSNTPVFICGETQTTNPDPTEIASVNRRLLQLNSDNDPYTGCVRSNGLQTDDGIHFSASSLRELGRRYAVEYLKLKRR